MNQAALVASEIRAGLEVSRVGRHLRVLDQVDSTNELALAAAADASEEHDGLVILAEWQRAGRGRLGRSWHSPRGASLLCSVALRAPVDYSMDRGLVLATPIAICEAIRDFIERCPAIRWPNDVTVGRRKVAGVLVESRVVPGGNRAFAVGIGLNCLQQPSHFPPELRGQATSLEMESRSAIDRTAVARALLAQLDRWLAWERLEHRAELVAAWHDWAGMQGQRVCLREQGRIYEGVAIDVDLDAGLLVELDQGGRRLFDPHTTSLV